jgi:uncharacterized protein YbjT (DUF2867 family)
MKSLLRRMLLLVIAGWLSAAAVPTLAADTVLVAGAAGRTGRAVVRQLVAAGHPVRAMVRSGPGLAEWSSETVSVVVADVRQPQTLAKAMDGVALAVVAIGASRGDPANGPEQVDFAGVRNLAVAARQAGLRRVVLVSSAGVTHEDHVLNRMFDNVLRWKARGEMALRESGVPYTIIRPGGLTDQGGAQGGIRIEQGDAGGGYISRADVARACIAALFSAEAENRTFEVYAGGRASPVNWDETFRALEPDPAGAP